jgi:hypothetical protein
MADFLRPAARATLLRLRGLALALVISGLGVWFAARSFGAMEWLGWLVAVLGAGLTIAQLQRLRFGTHSGGPGIVRVLERRLEYFGPLTGGIIDLDDLRRLALDGASQPPHWLLSGPGGQLVAVPVNAEGADSLFDAFAALPGLQSNRLIEAVQAPPPAITILWERNAPRLSGAGRPGAA